MLIILGEFLLGISAGLTLGAVAMADEEATAECTREAEQRVNRLRLEADRRVADVYDTHGPWMSPAVRQAYESRLGWR